MIRIYQYHIKFQTLSQDNGECAVPPAEGACPQFWFNSPGRTTAGRYWALKMASTLGSAGSAELACTIVLTWTHCRRLCWAVWKKDHAPTSSSPSGTMGLCYELWDLWHEDCSGLNKTLDYDSMLIRVYKVKMACDKFYGMIWYNDKTMSSRT